MDFDFAAQYGDLSIVAEKVYKKRDDEWNLVFRFARSYDILTFVAYMVYYNIIRTPYIAEDQKDHDRKHLYEIQRQIESVVDYIVDRVEKTIGPIKYLKHLKRDSANSNLRHYNTNKETEHNRSSISKMMDLVSIPQYRPYEIYCHVNLDDVLDVDAFRRFREKRSGGLLVSSM